MKPDYELATVGPFQVNGGHDDATVLKCDWVVHPDCHILEALTLEVFKKNGSRRFNPPRVDCWELSVNKIFQEAGAQMTVQQFVLKLVLIAPQATVTRPVTILGASLQNPQGFFKDSQSQSSRSFSKPGTPRKSVIQVDLCFATFPSRRG